MYTVLVGLIPVLLRMLIWLISQNKDADILNAVDFIVFGLILHISNINEIEHFDDREKSWKTTQNGMSVFLIIVYSVLFASHIFGQSNPGLVDDQAITIASVVLGIMSFIISFTVYDRTSKIE